MFETEGNQTALLRACQEAVGQLSVGRGWHLIEPKEWVDRTLAQVRAGPVADPQRVAVHIYSQVLYVACSGGQGNQRRDLGYGELFRYLYAMARKRYPLIHEDAAQQAITFVYDRFAQCRNPGTFLTFSFHQLLAAARIVSQQLEMDLRIDLSAALEDRDMSAVLPNRQVDPVGLIIDDERRASFERLSEEFLRKHPRAKLQLAALRLKFIDGLDEATISQRLQKPPASIYVLRSRAIEKLRAEPEWRALAIEFGILPEEQ
jgi:DNA-directed RNA polymerase specialized sigma24 family protein